MSNTNEYVQHHFKNMQQQHDAAKLGIWLFLATEILLFGGLFAGYAVFRANHPDLFAWGEQFLDERLGAANTAVLLVSSLTMAMAITYVQRERIRAASICLVVTFLCATIFMAIKSVEYEHKFHDHLVGGLAFYDVEHDSSANNEGSTVALVGDVTKGKVLWNATCRSCHGISGEGVAGQGIALNESPFVIDNTDEFLVEFIKVGRTAADPASTTQLQMPPKGGNPMLKDVGIHDIVAYVRTLQINKSSTIAEKPADASEDGEESVDEEIAVISQPDEPVEFLADLPRSSMPHAMQAPSGLAPEGASESQRLAVNKRPQSPQLDDNRPANAHLFFGLYFLMTGLHGIHVLVGMLIMLWLIYRLQRGDFNRNHYTAVECSGLYWHIVDVIWIFLFPLWYLIV